MNKIMFKKRGLKYKNLNQFIPFSCQEKSLSLQTNSVDVFLKFFAALLTLIIEIEFHRSMSKSLKYLNHVIFKIFI